MTPKQLLLSTFQSAINAALRLDPYTVQRLGGLAGKVVAVELRGVNLTLFLALQTDRIEVRGEHAGAVDARLSGTPLAFARLGLDIDWEEHLSRFTGDVIAHQVGNAARSSQRWAQQSGAALLQDAGEYLKYERELLPDRAQVETFMQHVDVLRDDVERLEARVQRLQKPINNKM
ncbi:MAG: SCP2 sterol-binding domain-containing protein [Gammaproteobacteria bacterium]|nr:SCP2 sterol-binding domain-containing protein [Gammaproteobacteria bacterium]